MYTKMQYFGDQEQQIRNRIHHPVDFNAQYAGRNKVRIVEQEGRGPYTRPDPDHPIDAVILESDPLAYYPLDWGNVGLDYSGNDFHGSVHGTFNRIVRQVGTREFRMSSADPGTGIKINDVDTSKGPLTIEFVTDGTDTTNKVLMERGFGGASNTNWSIQSHRLMVEGVEVPLIFVNYSGYRVVESLIEEPSHVVITVDDTSVKMYVNGVLAKSGVSRPQADLRPETPIHLFGRQYVVGGDYTHTILGSLSTVAFYKRVLSEEEIVNHHRVIFGGDFRSAQ